MKDSNYENKWKSLGARFGECCGSSHHNNFIYSWVCHAVFFLLKQDTFGIILRLQDVASCNKRLQWRPLTFQWLVIDNTFHIPPDGKQGLLWMVSWFLILAQVPHSVILTLFTFSDKMQNPFIITYNNAMQKWTVCIPFLKECCRYSLFATFIQILSGQLNRTHSLDLFRSPHQIAKWFAFQSDDFQTCQNTLHKCL